MKNRILMAGMTLVLLGIIYSACGEEAGKPAKKDIPPFKLFKALYPLAKIKRKPGPSDWLAQHKEPGQTFLEYLDINPVKPEGNRKILYITLLGKFDPTQKKIVDLTAEYMKIYFKVEVKFAKPIPLSRIAKRARRINDYTKAEQILSGYVLDKMLRPGLPKDGLAYIAFTSSDLWPGKGWNFVYGQASIKQRVGVWSIYRNGDPSASKEHFKWCLVRTIKTGTHETGHMLSMLHCIVYECNMNGSNHRAESDRNPLWLCPVCARKQSYATKANPIDRYKKLAAFCRKNNLKKRAAVFDSFVKVMEKTKIIWPKKASKMPEKGKLGENPTLSP